jgi:hypothetical protein
MTKILPNLLSDTFHLVALARETALKQGDQEKAEKLTTVADNLRGLVQESQQHGTKEHPLNLLGTSEFQALLSSVQAESGGSSPAANIAERQKVMSAMAAGGMQDSEIARTFGVTREEVRLIIGAQGDQSLRAGIPAGLQAGFSGATGGSEGGGQAPPEAHSRFLQSYSRWEK